MLPEVIEAKRGHGRLPSVPKVDGRCPSLEATPAAAACSSPPERLFGLAHDVAPGQPDIVEVAIGPMGQFAALTPPVAPDMEGLGELGQKSRTMMICH